MTKQKLMRIMVLDEERDQWKFWQRPLIDLPDDTVKECCTHHGNW